MKNYKVLTAELKSPNSADYSWEGWEDKIFSVENKLKMRRNGLHLYKSLKNISIGNFGTRVFEAEIIGNEIIEDDDKVCCRSVQLIKELQPEEVDDNKWIYKYCLDIQDRPELWNKLAENYWIYRYCKDVQDRPELWNKLAENYWIYRYCRDVQDRPELWNKLTDNRWIYHYCLDIQDRPELWNKLTDNRWIYHYCLDIQDRPELLGKLTDNEWIYRYCRYIKDRPELLGKLIDKKWIYRYCLDIQDKPELKARIKEIKMTDTITKIMDMVVKVTNDVAKQHPYKEKNKWDYNQGWSDACEVIEYIVMNELEKINNEIEEREEK